MGPRARISPGAMACGPEHVLYPPANAYRPFDTGSRSCIGQSLATTVIKIILVLAARRFLVDPAYDERDKLQEGKCGPWAKVTRGFRREKIRIVRGDRAYQSDKAGANPADGYPCRVSLVGRASTGS
jgi:hypothetical protein